MPGKQKGIRATVDEFSARHDSRDDLRHVFVNQRLAARNGHHRRATFLNRTQRVFDAHSLPQRLLWMINLAATGAG